MSTRILVGSAGLLLAGAGAFAQGMIVAGQEQGIAGPAGDEIIVALFWNDFISAGPSATDHEDDALDLWIVEDFELDQPVSLSLFESTGWVTSGNVNGITDVPVRIYDGLPWEGGQVVASSIEGEGWMADAGLWGKFSSPFENAELDPGSYHVAWQASRANVNVGIALFFAAPGEYDVGQGTPDLAYQWNPGGGFGWENDFQKVPADLDGNGCIGVNFTLRGVEQACAADYNGDGNLDILDFVAFQAGWQAQEAAADCDGSGTYDILDFVCFQQVFQAGCG